MMLASGLWVEKVLMDEGGALPDLAAVWCCCMVTGQALALRADLLKSPDYVRELEKLQDAVGVFPDPVAKRIMCEELGVEAPEDLFEFVQAEPIASASIGQVGRGTRGR